MVKTQKARGLKWLESGGITDYLLLKYQYITDFEVPESVEYPVFARPCPIRPRHGFVDSRHVCNEDQLRAILAETKEADEEGELVLAQVLENSVITHSAIFANGQLSIGLGNDGATSGKGRIVSFPMVQPDKNEPYPEDLIPEGDEAYLEFILDKWCDAFLVQVRNGPKLAGSSPDFIPRKTLVQGVLKPEIDQDLQEWEHLVENLGEGWVINALGHTLSSHFCVHGVLHGIPVVTTREVFIEEVLEATSEEVEPNENVFWQAFEDAWGPISDNRDEFLNKAARFSVICLHNSVPLMEKGRWDILGKACGLFARLQYIFCKGEYRHARIDKERRSRDSVYVHNLKYQPDDVLKDLRRMSNGFITHFDLEGSYGGNAWKDIADNCFDTYGASTAKEAIASWNEGVSFEHNGGWFMDKAGLDKVFLDHAANHTAWVTVNNMNTIHEFVLRDFGGLIHSIRPVFGRDALIVQTLRGSSNWTYVVTEYTKQAMKTLDKAGHFTHCYRGLPDKYVYARLVGIDSRWLTVDGKRIVKYEAAV